MPTATRPGHVAITAGFYEDPTSVAKGNENYNHLLQTDLGWGQSTRGHMTYIHTYFTCAAPEGGSGLLKNHKNIEFLSNIDTDQHSTLGHHRHASETQFKWRFVGGPMMARL